ncbi:uncharacterized protein BJ212DRAFT_1479140 [Suillus subaureus]|uniref:Fungal-type protein kinase domain-containing protein n=1 Tax=Suillus subaureus TaxID=48587 RepID=A0A9P7EDQ6_9AGAM|nr:uncharacterized protein BJ212DRAFT_1479140 [Suillus subaureus]KAG1819012.1 hypothetical protein BJ212DRAFT_1479140 [Suillus subaureus]
MFQMLKEFIRVIRDIVNIQRVAVEDHKILHHDCSLNNAMILDDLDLSKEFLIDWEFSVHITADNRYPISGTGTVPFMSCMLLSQVSLLQQQVNAEAEQKKMTNAHKLKLKLKLKKAPALKTPKTSSDSIALPVSHVVQTFSDDLKSLFFIFAWVCIKFCGPNGAVCQEHVPNSLLDCWASLDLASCAAFKITFFTNPLDEQHLLNEFHPYFKPLIVKNHVAQGRERLTQRGLASARTLCPLPDPEDFWRSVGNIRRSAGQFRRNAGSALESSHCKVILLQETGWKDRRSEGLEDRRTGGQEDRRTEGQDDGGQKDRMSKGQEDRMSEG